MKSVIVGEMEALARPLIEEATTAWIVGLPMTLSPERAKAYGRAIELMAQCIDAQEARHRVDRQFRWAIYRLLVIAALFFAAVWTL